mgnify:FL=1|jgi:hypothetical protein|tara:strand:+ start:7563 stop:8066 length:504 start_codon:yes stop_codon:yes gene_type:complete
MQTYKVIIIGATALVAILFYAQKAHATLELEEAFPWIEISKASTAMEDMEDYLEDNREATPEESPEQPMPEQPTSPDIVVFPEALPCQAAEDFLKNMRLRHGLIPYAKGTAVVRNAQTFEFSRPDMVMLYNPEVQSWMMVGMWTNGYACVLGSGTDFRPYQSVEDSL